MIEEVRERWAKATPGPWELRPWMEAKPNPQRETQCNIVGNVDLVRRCNEPVCILRPGAGRYEENKAAIVNAPADIAFLLAEIDRLKAEIELRNEEDKKVSTAVCNLVAELRSIVEEDPDHICETCTLPGEEGKHYLKRRQRSWTGHQLAQVIEKIDKAAELSQAPALAREPHSQTGNERGKSRTKKKTVDPVEGGER